MIIIEIPGRPTLRLEHLVSDFNGTIAAGGQLLAGVAERLVALSEKLHLTVVTADTYGRVRNEMENLPVDVTILAGNNEDIAKAAHVAALGADATVALGNGHNDRLMLSQAVLGLAVLGVEGAAGSAWQAADVLFVEVRDALDAVLDPRRLVATLRS
jgi:soluble P-type ATPase